MSPKEVRSIYDKLGWHRIVGFQTRTPIQRIQFEMTIRAMRQAKANLLLLMVTGMTKPGDFDHYTRVRCYREVTRHYPPNSFVLNLLPLSLRLAGPRDALLHAIYSTKSKRYYQPGRRLIPDILASVLPQSFLDWLFMRMGAKDA